MAPTGSKFFGARSPATSMMSKLMAAMTVSVACASCGSGGSSSPDAPASPTSPSPSGPPATAPATATPASADPLATTCALPDFEASLLAKVNALRAQGGTCTKTGETPSTFAPSAALSWNTPLTNAAIRHSQDLAKPTTVFSHTGSDGSSPFDRMREAGYVFTMAGENIAAGQSSIQAVLDGWMASKGHCENILNTGFRDIGVACTKVDTGSMRYFWTMTLGKR